MPMGCKSRLFVKNEYTAHKKYKEINDIGDITQKRYYKHSSVTLRTTNKKKMCVEILLLRKIIEETPNRMFHDNYFGDILPNVTTELKPVTYGNEDIKDKIHLKSLARNILLTNNSTECNTLDLNNSHDDIILALQQEDIENETLEEETQFLN